MIAGLVTYLVYPALGWMNSELGWRTTLVDLGVVLAVTSVPTHLLSGVRSGCLSLFLVRARVAVWA
jgi:hypothetical protein